MSSNLNLCSSVYYAKVNMLLIQPLICKARHEVVTIRLLNFIRGAVAFYLRLTLKTVVGI